MASGSVWTRSNDTDNVHTIHIIVHTTTGAYTHMYKHVADLNRMDRFSIISTSSMAIALPFMKEVYHRWYEDGACLLYLFPQGRQTEDPRILYRMEELFAYLRTKELITDEEQTELLATATIGMKAPPIPRAHRYH